MEAEQCRLQWLREERETFRDWDFSHIADRCEEEPLPWDYRSIVQRYRRDGHRLLDMGTGGGELLLSLLHPCANTTVTESWEPNIQLCKDVLEPLGMRVVPVRKDGKDADGRLPFDDDSFDLIINRHSDYDLAEVRRVLTPEGLFITQQVGGKDGVEFSRKLINGYEHAFAGFDLSSALKCFSANGFSIVYSDEAFPCTYYTDVGAIVYFAKAVPWEFPGFSVESHLDQLYALQRELKGKGRIEAVQHRFIVVAVNTKGGKKEEKRQV